MGLTVVATTATVRGALRTRLSGARSSLRWPAGVPRPRRSWRATGWYAAGRVGAAPEGRLRAGTVLIARGEFSIVIAALGSSLVNGPELGALAAGYILLTAIIGPIAAEFADHIPLPTRLMRQRTPART